VAKFTLIAIGCSAVGGIIGIGRIGLVDHSDWSAILSSWAGWWACDVAGALVVAPPVVLWANDIRSCSPIVGFGKLWLQKFLVAGTALVGAGVIGVVAFSPLIPDTAGRSALGFLAVLPLLWGSLRCGHARHCDGCPGSVGVCHLGSPGRDRSLRCNPTKRFILNPGVVRTCV
jgi:integral membrane sensor domain MASE1